jgi:hypothetical protein
MTSARSSRPGLSRPSGARGTPRAGWRGARLLQVARESASFRIEDEARKLRANYVQGGLFKAFAIRDDHLITGQQQYSGTKVAQLVIECPGV